MEGASFVDGRAVLDDDAMSREIEDRVLRSVEQAGNIGASTRKIHERVVDWHPEMTIERTRHFLSVLEDFGKIVDDNKGLSGTRGEKWLLRDRSKQFRLQPTDYDRIVEYIEQNSPKEYVPREQQGVRSTDIAEALGLTHNMGRVRNALTRLYREGRIRKIIIIKTGEPNRWLPEVKTCNTT